MVAPAWITEGIRLVHDERCPACKAAGKDQPLSRQPPTDRFHYHGEMEFVDPPYMWCPEDGQGYRVVTEADGELGLRILPPCNGGLHSDGDKGYR